MACPVKNVPMFVVICRSLSAIYTSKGFLCRLHPRPDYSYSKITLRQIGCRESRAFVSDLERKKDCKETTARRRGAAGGTLPPAHRCIAEPFEDSLIPTSIARARAIQLNFNSKFHSG